MSTLSRAALGAALLTFFAASPAGAAVTIGSDLSGEPLAPAPAGVLTQAVVPTGVTHPLAAPSAGVVTRIRLRVGATAAGSPSVGFRIMSGSGSQYTTRLAAVPSGSPPVDQRFALEPNLPVEARQIIDFRPTLPSGMAAGIPIAAGERLGVAVAGGASIAGAATGGFIGLLAGADQLPVGSQTFPTTPNVELLVQATIEPDADGDGFGDETQDQCPGRPNDADGRCVPEQLPGKETTVTVPGPTVTQTIAVPGPERVVTVTVPAAGNPTPKPVAKKPAPKPCAKTKGDARLRCLSRRACRTKKAGKARKACEKRELAKRRRAAKK